MDKRYCVSRVLVIVLLLSSCLPGRTTIADSLDEAGVVARLHDNLLEVMKQGDGLGYQGRYNVLKDIIPEVFNIPLIAQVVLGRQWQELDSEQQYEFILLYQDLITATYASRFNGYDGEVFVHDSNEPLNRGRMLVKTRLIPGDANPVNLDYLMDRSNSNWQIISVIANGANDISIKRAEYADVIRMRGYGALIEEIRNKISQLSNT